MKHCENKLIKKQSKRISEEKLNFKGGLALGDVDICIDSGQTRNKIRRIIEKRVSQDYWNGSNRGKGNLDRYRIRHYVSNQFKYIYGAAPQTVRQAG